MAVNWTPEQQKVINLRNRNLLVSAAAGSGKTAVLVERILAKICDPVSPVDIDRLLVVTFTKAAAAEMRERILLALEERSEKQPHDGNVKRQLALLHNAMITTIDSFCVYVVRNYFQDIGLAPDFRIADSGELLLAEEDAMDALFEKNYASGDNQEFLSLMDAYAGKRNDSNVRDMVKKLYRMSVSHPWPKEWLRRQSEENNEERIGICIETAKHQISEIRKELSLLRETAREAGLDKYVTTLEQDLEKLGGIEQVTDYAGMTKFLAEHTLGSLAAIRGYEGDASVKEFVKDRRNERKAKLEELKRSYFFLSPEELQAQQERIRPYRKELVRLALSYGEELAELKARKHMVDFGDIEHDALSILVDEKSRECRPAALEFRRQFDEIMIDEYQDSNEVQEAILRAISGESEGRYNLFMVGDVKQSIYRFRLARPELFMQKYDSYSSGDADCQKIDLHQNFRSRKEVLDSVNDIFYKIMGRDLGDVAYDSNAELHYGASSYPDSSGNETELLLLDKQDEFAAELSGESNPVLEAHLIAGRIEKLRREFRVTDKETGVLRPVRFSDIVILIRSIKDWGEEFARVLNGCGIPAHVESQIGYFSSTEVQVVLSMLRILDNPYQDIPMAAVLKSPIAGLSDEELAQISVKHEELPFAMAVAAAAREAEMAADNKKDETAEKLRKFRKLYLELRSEVRDTPVHELLNHILERTNYGAYAAMLPAGAQRSANLNMLLEKAIAYEKTSYKGLFHFVRYIDELQKYEVDFGEADVMAENEDVVRIMTIHKSKGLEFPVVFVSGMNKQFNRRDSKEVMVLHPELGIGIEERCAEPRLKRNHLYRTLIRERLEQENLGEELRVLYVALTRAKEKLIMTGVISDRGKWYQTHRGNRRPGELLTYMERRGADSYLDWVFSAWLSYPKRYEVTFVEPKELVVREVYAETEKKLSKEHLEKEIKNADLNTVSALDEQISYVYPYLNEAGRKGKYSVSELKHASMVEQFDRGQGDMEIPDFLLEEKESYVPFFAREDSADDGEKSKSAKRAKTESDAETGKSSETAKTTKADAETGELVGAKMSQVSQGALRGTAVHRFMECLDFAAILEIDFSDREAPVRFVTEQRDKMKKNGLLTEDMAKLIWMPVMEKFIVSPVARRMAKADREGKLFREKPFVMDYDGVLLQGIIDVFWQEKNKIIVLDYKTDRVDTKEELVLRYKKQLELYGEALARLFSTEKRKVSADEQLIYSFRLGETIPM